VKNLRVFKNPERVDEICTHCHLVSEASLLMLTFFCRSHPKSTFPVASPSLPCRQIFRLHFHEVKSSDSMEGVRHRRLRSGTRSPPRVRSNSNSQFGFAVQLAQRQLPLLDMLTVHSPLHQPQRGPGGVHADGNIMDLTLGVLRPSPTRRAAIAGAPMRRTEVRFSFRIWSPGLPLDTIDSRNA